MSDSLRWDRLELRDGDVIISTPVKSGTTWMQMCVALVIFQDPALPKPMAELSPWLEMLTRSVDDVVALLGAQRHRRFIKSHTPFDGLPDDQRVTYICVGRDPRDIPSSLKSHLANWKIDAVLEAREAAVGLDDLGPDDVPQLAGRDPIEQFWAWVDASSAPGEDPEGLAGCLHHLQTFWDRRDDPNVALFHYADLETDLEGQMRRLADVLEIDVADERWEVLVSAATFASMKERADVLAPDTIHGVWKDNSGFFDRGRSGRWRDLPELDTARFDARVSALAAPDLASWARHGWLGRD